MITRISTFIFAFLFCFYANAQSWLSTGGIIVKGVGACGFATLSSNTLITSAHCITKPHTNHPVPLTDIIINLSGSNPISTTPTSVALPSGFVRSKTPDYKSISNDKALLKINLQLPGPFETASSIHTQTKSVFTPIKYSNTVKHCPIKNIEPQYLVLNCRTYQRSSGSPVFATINDHRHLVGIISSNGYNSAGQSITFATKPDISNTQWAWFH